MAQLSRVTQKIFCSTGSQQTAVFGTMKSGSPTYSTNIATLMGNTAWNSGWSGAIIAGKAPFMEEFNAIERVNTQQIAYILQSGIPEWDSGTDYYTGNIVKVVTSGVVTVWGATASSTNKDPTSTSGYWTKYFDSTVPYLTQGLISNCITEIPENIKIELISGGFTLKAGTNYYMPDGTVHQTTSDITKTTAVGGGAGFSVVCINEAGTTLRYRNLAACVSGAGVTTVGGFVYNTTTNKVEFYDSTGTMTTDDNSFPLMILETDSSGFAKSIYKLFNCAGYIGHHAFVLPGVSFLLGNGKNADGTLSSAAYTKTNLTIIELDTTRKAITMLSSTGAERNTDFITVKTYNDLSTNIGQTVQYVIDENKSYRLTSSTPHVIVESNRTLLVRFNYDGSSVTQFDIEKPIRLDDKASIGGNNDFLGTNTVPTPATTDNSKQIANTEFVKAAIASNDVAPRDITTLWSDPSGQGSGTMNLSEPFTNFEKIGVYFAKDNLQAVTVYVQDTYWLNRILTNSSHDVMIATLGDASWSIKNYSDSTPSTTTKFVAGHESGVLFYIYGINRISS